MHEKPQVSYSFRDDTLIMAFVKNGFGVTVSQDLVMRAFSDGVEVRPLEPESHRTIGLSFARTTNSVVSGVLLDYLQKSLAEIRFEPIRLLKRRQAFILYISRICFSRRSAVLWHSDIYKNGK